MAQPFKWYWYSGRRVLELQRFEYPLVDAPRPMNLRFAALSHKNGFATMDLYSVQDEENHLAPAISRIVHFVTRQEDRSGIPGRSLHQQAQSARVIHICRVLPLASTATVEDDTVAVNVDVSVQQGTVVSLNLVGH
ncbi:MAG: hypothetical protein KIT47_13865 [Rhodoferax sp.]|nr:hypothetical protein [Rhodoferax sp.]